MSTKHSTRVKEFKKLNPGQVVPSPVPLTIKELKKNIRKANKNDTT